uniref:60S ribosomal protein L32 n=1 Tax=Podarcis muralis TaxID=64176 RepID=A0A670IUC7_PODMU
MPALRPLMKPKIIKKRTKKFICHQSDCVARCGPATPPPLHNGQKPRGIVNRVRRRFEGQILMPNIGYGRGKKTKHMLAARLAIKVTNPNVRLCSEEKE